MNKLKATHVGPRTHPPYVLSRELHVKQNAKREKILSFHKPNRLRVGLGDPSHLLSSWQVSFATGQKMLKEKIVLSFCYFSVFLCYTRPNRQSSKLVLKSSLVTPPRSSFYSKWVYLLSNYRPGVSKSVKVMIWGELLGQRLIFDDGARGGDSGVKQKRDSRLRMA